MQSQRLFEIVFLLMERSPRTVSDLARHMEVSERTIRRDIEALSAADVPVYMTRGRGGGVHLMEGYVLDRSVLSERERSDILAAMAALERTGAVEDSTTGRLTHLFQQDSTNWLDLDFSFWGAPQEYREAFDIMRDAIIARHPLSFTYVDACDQRTKRVVEPAQLVFKESCWYLRAWCRMRQAWRTFKLFRIDWDSLCVLPETFERRALPPFDEGTATAGPTHLVLRFAPHAEQRVREEFAPSAIERLPCGSWRVVLDCQLNERARYYLLSFGALLEVEEPAEVREWLRQEALAVARHYKN